jgi:hypothetical protein
MLFGGRTSEASEASIKIFSIRRKFMLPLRIVNEIFLYPLVLLVLSEHYQYNLYFASSIFLRICESTRLYSEATCTGHSRTRWVGGGEIKYFRAQYKNFLLRLRRKAQSSPRVYFHTFSSPTYTSTSFFSFPALGVFFRQCPESFEKILYACGRTGEAKIL